MGMKLPVSGKDTEQKKRSSKNTVDKQIFIVEDEEIIRNLYKDILGNNGYELLMSKTVKEGKSNWGDGNYDLVICDLGLPGENGWGFIKFVRENNQSIPIVALTGWGDMISKEQSSKFNIQRVVAKPVSVGQLLKLVSDLTSEEPSVS
ncbi:MAG: response regulator [Calditrichaceae bacterium]